MQVLVVLFELTYTYVFCHRLSQKRITVLFRPMINSQQHLMKKIHSFHLPKVIKNDRSLPQENDNINEHAAQQSLFQISKLDELHINSHQQFMRDLSKHTSPQKREQRSSLSLPRKKQLPQMPPLELKAFQQTFLHQSSNLQSIGITNYVVIDNRRQNRHYRKQSQLKSKRSSLHEQINRKAKYLFRTRNKPKTQDKGQLLFFQSFYCSKIQSTAAEEN